MLTDEQVAEYRYAVGAARKAGLPTMGISVDAIAALLSAHADAVRLREALEGIANMPEYDQDDSYRLRHQARAALRPAAQGGG